MSALDTARLGDDSRGLTRDRRVTYAGMFPWRRWLWVTVVAGLVAQLVSAVLFVVARQLPDSPVSMRVFEVAIWTGCVGIACAVMALAALAISWLFPVDAVAFYRRGGDPTQRRLAKHVARDWRRIAPRVFPPIVTARGDVAYPGIHALVPDDGVGVRLLLRMPNAAPSGGIEEYLAKAAEELPKRLDLPIYDAVPGRTSANRPGLALFAEDLTEQTRAVTL